MYIVFFYLYLHLYIYEVIMKKYCNMNSIFLDIVFF